MKKFLMASAASALVAGTAYAGGHGEVKIGVILGFTGPIEALTPAMALFDEPAKFTAKLREYKTDNNLLLLKTEMNAGHGGKSGRDGAIEEIALDYAFALKISKKI